MRRKTTNIGRVAETDSEGNVFYVLEHTNTHTYKKIKICFYSSPGYKVGTKKDKHPFVFAKMKIRLRDG